MSENPRNTALSSVTPQELPNVRVNQVGYLPNNVKRAIIVNSSTTPLNWELLNDAGTCVASGMTTVFGSDPASGDHVHTADFSAYTTSGSGYTLRVNQDVSHAFTINSDIYWQLKYDALAYFYHTRSGIAIEAEFVGSDLARPAGHVGIAPNRGDNHVPCAPDIGCSYELDVSGGWYDAGDQGKYVVNGGISVWTLMHQYERAQYLSGALDALADGTLGIPENHNGVPDILDEVRWEMDFLLKMQVPEGQPLAGLVHHKVHDAAWTALPIRPDQDPQPRYLRPPSTAATLNLAAAAAQCSRVWAPFDLDYAATCLSAAERAWAAAQQHPALFAPASDTVGGGPYQDDNVADEFYWAAAELFVTTHDAEYQRFMQASPYYLTIPTTFGDHSAPAMTWAATQSLGTITLATVPNDLPVEAVESARQNIIAAANSFVATLEAQGYRVPFAPGSDGKYPWGSNSFILNNLIIIGLAYDFTYDPTYLAAVIDGMDYLLGRNPLDKSYVSGYGARPLEHPHHRFWAHQLDPTYPTVPPGVIAGGPNSHLQDPYAQSIGLPGSPPQKCYVDHINSWSTNEVTINWNAPLAWVTAFLDEQANY